MNKNKAIFLDRDGTLNHAHIKNNNKNEFKLRPPYQLKEFRLFGDIKFLNRYSRDYLLIILSNQPDLISGDQTYEFHNFINKQIKKNIRIHDFFFCVCLKKDPNCQCYKPKNLMLTKAINKYNIDIKKSYLIGDTWRDIKLANSKKLSSILIDRGYYKYLKKDFIINSAKYSYKIKSLYDLHYIIDE